MSVPRILVVGSANVDYTVAVSRLPNPGETVSGGTLLVNQGGKGANQAVAARRLGAEVRFIGCVGDDAAGRGVRAALAREGIGVEGMATSAEAATGTALIIVDREGRNLIAVAPGANRRLDLAHVRGRGDDFDWADVVLTQFEVPLDTVGWVLAEARRRGRRTMLNPAPVPERSLDLWAAVDWLTPNRGEAGALSGITIEDDTGVASAAAVLRERGVRTVVVTLGEAGSLAVSDHGAVRVPAFNVAAVDTTAAGDAFNGALAIAVAEDRPLTEALRFAGATAALACTRRGAQDSLPHVAEVEALLDRPFRASRAGS